MAGGATRLLDFDQHVLPPLRATIRDAHLGRTGTSLLNWLSLDHHHLRTSVSLIVSYAAIAAAFRGAQAIEVVQTDGRVLPMRVVPVSSGHRRQLLLDLTARIIDSDELPVDLIIVSNWARTGWNIVTPNVLIDATATRSVTAWQQLAGRAVRPAPTWSSDAQRLVQRLVGSSETCRREIPGRSVQTPWSCTACNCRQEKSELAERYCRSASPGEGDSGRVWQWP